MPYLFGLLGMYTPKLNFPLKVVNISSTVANSDKLKCFDKLALKTSNITRISAFPVRSSYHQSVNDAIKI